MSGGAMWNGVAQYGSREWKDREFNFYLDTNLIIISSSLFVNYPQN